MAGGDSYKATGGSWQIQKDVAVFADRTGGADQLCNEVADKVKQAGYNIVATGVGPDKENELAAKGGENITVFYIANGIDRYTIAEYVYECDDQHFWMGPQHKLKHCNMVVGWWTSGGGACNQKNMEASNIGVHDWTNSTAIVKPIADKYGSAKNIIEQGMQSGWVAGPDSESLASGFLTGSGAGGTSTGGVQIVEGFMTSGRGISEQYFNPENYEPLTEIPFYEVSVTEEDYEVKTAEFKTHERIDLTSGRVYVLIQGDPGQFGGVILERSYDPQSRMYTYTCQEMMARVMANTVYAIYNKSKNVYDWLHEIYEDVGIPTTGFGELEDYDEAIDPQYLEDVKKEEKETQALDSDNNNPTDANTDNTGNNTNNNTDSTADGTSSDTLKATQNQNGETELTTNPFDKKPRGIYDKQTILDHTRTLLYDYGVHVRFYGDVTGVPIFKAYTREEWLNTGWYIQPQVGYQTDYEHNFDITNVVTQVGVKNIEALKPTGELYTSEDLFGINTAGCFGRMGVIVDNPTPQGNVSAATSTQEDLYEDDDGNTYTADQVISTNGYPQCSNDATKNGGKQPEYTQYQKYWVNKCAKCECTKTLKDNAPNSDGGGKEGKTECDKTKTSEPFTNNTNTTSNTGNSNNTTNNNDNTNSNESKQKGCGATFCQYCGKNLNGNGTLIEVHKKTSTTNSNTSSTDSNSGNSDSNKSNNSST